MCIRDRFTGDNKFLAKCVKEVAGQNVKGAAAEAVSLNGGCNEIAVAVDTSWQKRCHTSNNGIVSVISFDSGKVIDFHCLTKYCQRCFFNNLKKDHHRPECVSNYSATNGGIEIARMLIVFKRSLTERGVKYMQYRGDRDSK